MLDYAANAKQDELRLPEDIRHGNMASSSNNYLANCITVLLIYTASTLPWSSGIAVYPFISLSCVQVSSPTVQKELQAMLVCLRYRGARSCTYLAPQYRKQASQRRTSIHTLFCHTVIWCDGLIVHIAEGKDFSQRRVQKQG